jgi:hypothetical protein
LAQIVRARIYRDVSARVKGAGGETPLARWISVVLLTPILGGVALPFL